MLVMKFGGTSVASSENITKVKNILFKKTEPFIVVVSAFSKVTDKLHKIAELSLKNEQGEVFENLMQHHKNIASELIKSPKIEETHQFIDKQFATLQVYCDGIFALQELSERTLAKVMSYGETLSSFIIHKFLEQEGMKISLLPSREIVKANGNYLKAELDAKKTDEEVSKLVNKEKNYIAPGFIASNSKNETVLLGRGGSDYTAAIFASIVNANILEIWSDVNGMLNANPKYVKEAFTINELSYKEAFELSHYGAKVLYPPTIRPVMRRNIPVLLKNTFEPEHKGTYIGKQISKNVDKIKGVSSLPDISIITIAGVGLAGIKGTARRVFQSLENAKVNVVLIVQSCSEHSICVGVDNSEANAAAVAMRNEFKSEIESELVDPIEVANDFSVIALVGDNMKYQSGLSGKAFGALGKNGINVIAIAQGASERNISIVISKQDEKKAINVLHESFFQDTTKKVHLFIAGIGNVGGEFVKILHNQKAHLLANYSIELIVAGVANSKKMMINVDGIDISEIQNINTKGVEYHDFYEFVNKMRNINLRNSIFIDNTASDIVSSHYESVLQKSISVVACNKIACSSVYSNYFMLKQTAKDKNCQFRYETCVGAALPVIKTIHDLILSGDKVRKIQAVLSGSLNFIFNNYDTTVSFDKIVMQAKIEGYTEPNPLIDLSGVDVMRKILILARETGSKLEMSEVKCNSFLPESCLNAKTTDILFEEMAKNEAHFKALYDNAKKKGNKLKVVASFENGQASVGLQEVTPDSPFFHLEGKDNIVSINSDRYPKEPLVIKGAGAGAAVTASGVFSDLMLVLNM